MDVEGVMRFKLRQMTLSLIALTAMTSKVGLGLGPEEIITGAARFPRLVASNLEKRRFGKTGVKIWGWVITAAGGWYCVPFRREKQHKQPVYRPRPSP